MWRAWAAPSARAISIAYATASAIGEPALPADPLLQRLALDVLEHDVRPALVLAGVDHPDDVRVGELRDRPRLAAEALELVGVGRDLAVQQLDRHLPLERLVERAVDRSTCRPRRSGPPTGSGRSGSFRGSRSSTYLYFALVCPSSMPCSPVSTHVNVRVDNRAFHEFRPASANLIRPPALLSGGALGVTALLHLRDRPGADRGRRGRQLLPLGREPDRAGPLLRAADLRPRLPDRAAPAAVLDRAVRGARCSAASTCCRSGSSGCASGRCRSALIGLLGRRIWRQRARPGSARGRDRGDLPAVHHRRRLDDVRAAVRAAASCVALLLATRARCARRR